MYHVALVWMLIRLSHGQLTVVIGRQGGKGLGDDVVGRHQPLGDLGKTGWMTIETLMDING